MIWILAAIYGIGFVNEKLIKKKSTAVSIAWPAKSAVKILAWADSRLPADFIFDNDLREKLAAWYAKREAE